MGAIVLVVDDAAVFAHLEFVAVPIGHGAVAFVVGQVVRIDPEIIVDALVVLEQSG